MNKLYRFLFLAKFCEIASLVLSHSLPISTPEEAGMQVTGTSHVQDMGGILPESQPVSRKWPSERKEKKPQNLALQGKQMSLLTLPCWSPAAPGPLLQTPFQWQTLQLEFKRAGSMRGARFLKDFTQNLGPGVKPQGFVSSFVAYLLLKRWDRFLCASL